MSNELTNSTHRDMRKLLKEDSRYRYEAYQFIREALQFAHENMPELLKRADQAMYFSKQNGRNRVTVLLAEPHVQSKAKA